MAAAAAANQPSVSLPALAAAAAAAAQQQPNSSVAQQQQSQQQAQQILYQNVAVQPNSSPAIAQMAQMGMPGLLQTPTAVSSSLHTPQQFLAAAAASPQYSTVQKILIPGSKVRNSTKKLSRFDVIRFGQSNLHFGHHRKK